MTPEEVLAKHEPLVQVIAWQYRTSRWAWDDLCQEGRTALWQEAVKRPGDDLAKLASWVIKRRIVRVVERGHSLGSEAPVGNRGTERQDHLHIEGFNDTQREVFDGRYADASAEDEYQALVTEREIGDRLSALSDRDRQIVEGKLLGESSAVVGERHGLTRQRVNQIFRQLVTQLEEVAPVGEPV